MEGEGVDEDDQVPSFLEYNLPNKEFEGLWDSLHYDTDVKSKLLSYA